MMRHSRWLLAVGLLSALFLVSFVACGDDSTSSNTPTPGGSGSNSSPTNGTDLFLDLDRLTQGLDRVTGKTSYTITSEAGGESHYTVYADGTNTRLDVSDPDGVTYTSITRDGSTITCESTSEVCVSSSESLPGAAVLSLFTSFLSSSTIGAAIAQAQTAGADLEQSTERHAGTDAACYAWTEDASGGASSGKVCFASNGVLLFEEIKSDSGTFKVEATEFSENVSESDFDPPYAVQ